MNIEDNTKSLAQQGQAVADKAADVTKDAMRSPPQAADRTLETMSDKVDEATGRVAGITDKVVDAANSGITQAREAWRDASAQVKDWAQETADTATGYARDEPAKAMLIAAAAGAVLMAALVVMVRSRD